MRWQYVLSVVLRFFSVKECAVPHCWVHERQTTGRVLSIHLNHFKTNVKIGTKKKLKTIEAKVILQF